MISAYHHWISGVGLPTTSQYSSKVSPVCFVSDIGDFTKPAGKEMRSVLGLEHFTQLEQEGDVKRPSCEEEN